jgi:lantibiotic transport system permease protein
MSFIASTQAELLKTKRTASFWLSIAGAAFIPAIFLISFFTDAGAVKNFAKEPWSKYIFMGWQILCVFLLPMYIILVSTLITQIEFKNNTWKQVFASPQSLGNIFFSKFLTIHITIAFCFLLFDTFMLLAAVIANLFKPDFAFLHSSLDWQLLLKINMKVYISILAMSAIQYWLSLRFKNFIAPVGIGLAMVIGSIVALNLNWKHIYKLPYSFPILTLDGMKKTGRPLLENHELNSIGIFLFFILVGFLDMKTRKEKG